MAALLLAAGAAQAADWRHLESLPPDRIVPEFYRLGADHALWTISTDGMRRSAGDATRALRRSATGPRLPIDRVRDLLPLADGGALLDVSGSRDNLGGYCAAARLRLDGRAPWHVELPLRDETCRGYYANTTGQGWFFAGERLIPVDADGRVGTRSANIGQPYWTRPVAVFDDGSAVAATRLRGVETSKLARFGSDGHERWSWVRQDQKPLAFVTLAGDGIVAVAGDDTDAAPKELLRWNAAGQLLWTYALPAASVVTEVIAADAGDTYVVLGNGPYRAKTVQRIGAGGSRQWETTLDCTMSSQFAATLARMADDGLALACQDAPPVSRLLRLSRTGALAALPLPLDIPMQVLPQAGGHMLVLGLQQPSGTPAVRRTLIVDGTQVEAAAPDDFRDAAAGRIIGHQLLADGTSIIATALETPQSPSAGFVLTRLAADGRVIWRQHLAEPAYRGGNALAVGGGLVCIALDRASTTVTAAGGMDGVACVRDIDGDHLWTVPYTNDVFNGFVALAVDESGTVRTLRSRLGQHELQRLRRDGTVESNRREPGHPVRGAFDARGALSVVTAGELRQYAPDGTLRLRIAASNAPIALGMNGGDTGVLLAGDDGSLWIIGPPATGSATARRIWAVAPDGSTRWTRELTAVALDRLLLRGNALYGIGIRNGSIGTDRSVEVVLERMDAQRGDIAWSQGSRHTPFASHAGLLAASPDGRQVLVAHGEFDRLHLERLDAADGRPAHAAFIACDRLCGVPAALALADDGNARIALDVLDRDRGQTGAIVATDLSAVTTRLDQPGIAGAWWSPYAHGEGIAFDWLPASRTVFGAWFTYSTAGGNEPSELRWYTVQANSVADGARSLELPILETIGGNFDAGPAVAPRRVGTARIGFYDCNRGTLHYAFDAAVNDGRSGTITLSRLSAATRGCVLADGSSVPAPAAPPANGFDAKLSGNWFDAATTGQGLQVTVQPGGVFFAPWFTFDPAGAGNDPGRQHWFTLQGNLAGASNGVAELLLVQTIGGRFDAVPTYNADRIGTATLRVLGCDRAELDYRFDDASGAHAFRARNGTLRLSRAGGCAN